MASAAATEIEEHKRSVFITVGKNTPHVAIDFIVIHIIVVQHLIINRPLIEEIVSIGFSSQFFIFRLGFSFSYRPIIQFNSRNNRTTANVASIPKVGYAVRPNPIALLSPLV